MQSELKEILLQRHQSIESCGRRVVGGSVDKDDGPDSPRNTAGRSDLSTTVSPDLEGRSSWPAFEFNQDNPTWALHTPRSWVPVSEPAAGSEISLSSRGSKSRTTSTAQENMGRECSGASQGSSGSAEICQEGGYPRFSGSPALKKETSSGSYHCSIDTQLPVRETLATICSSPNRSPYSTEDAPTSPLTSPLISRDLLGLSVVKNRKAEDEWDCDSPSSNPMSVFSAGPGDIDEFPDTEKEESQWTGRPIVDRGGHMSKPRPLDFNTRREMSGSSQNSQAPRVPPLQFGKVPNANGQNIVGNMFSVFSKAAASIDLSSSAGNEENVPAARASNRVHRGPWGGSQSKDKKESGHANDGKRSSGSSDCQPSGKNGSEAKHHNISTPFDERDGTDKSVTQSKAEGKPKRRAPELAPVLQADEPPTRSTQVLARVEDIRSWLGSFPSVVGTLGSLTGVAARYSPQVASDIAEESFKLIVAELHASQAAVKAVDSYSTPLANSGPQQLLNRKDSVESIKRLNTSDSCMSKNTREDFMENFYRDEDNAEQLSVFIDDEEGVASHMPRSTITSESMDFAVEVLQAGNPTQSTKLLATVDRTRVWAMSFQTIAASIEGVTNAAANRSPRLISNVAEVAAQRILQELHSSRMAVEAFDRPEGFLSESPQQKNDIITAIRRGNPSFSVRAAARVNYFRKGIVHCYHFIEHSKIGLMIGDRLDECDKIADVYDQVAASPEIHRKPIKPSDEVVASSECEQKDRALDLVKESSWTSDPDEMQWAI